MLVDLRPKDINGKQAQEVLDRAGITVNKNAIPFDTYPIFKPGGIRIGTPAVTTRGMKEEEMLEIADLINDALTIAMIRSAGTDSRKVRELTNGSRCHRSPKEGRFSRPFATHETSVCDAFTEFSVT